MTNETKELHSMVKEMLDTGDRNFTDWEIDFLEKMDVHSGEFSDSQAGKIIEIYRQRM